jgi:hypothetical protein
VTSKPARITSGENALVPGEPFPVKRCSILLAEAYRHQEDRDEKTSPLPPHAPLARVDHGAVA